MLENITFGICTYNREDVLRIAANSLYTVQGIENVHIRVYDDNSNQYDRETLRDIYHSADTIKRNETNLGSDLNIRKMYEDFLNYDDEYLFNADSDLIYDAKLLDRIDETIKYFTSEDKKDVLIVSFFNTMTHPSIGEYSKEYLLKKHIGSAGTLMNRKAVELIVENVYSENLDYEWCRFFSQRGYPILCTKRSFVQHIGIYGQNTFINNFDWGQDFKVDTIENAIGIQYVMERMDFCQPLHDKLVNSAGKGQIKLKTLICVNVQWIKFYLIKLFRLNKKV